jgi:hypothetical protein
MEPSSNESVIDFKGQQVHGVFRSEPTELINRSDLVHPVPGTGKDECYVMLAQVNLLRIRKQTMSALELCETVLAKWPLRADAHSLMGDIYQELGRVDDAILRYCRVLELDPKSKANSQKLSEMVRLKKTQIGPTSIPNPKRGGLRIDRFVRAAILAMATLMLGTIMMAPIIFNRRKNPQPDFSPTTVDKRINLSPIMLEPLQPSPNLPTQEQPPPSSAAVIRDPAEQAIVDIMSNDKVLLQQGIQVLDAQEDPASNGFAITFLDRPSSSTAVTKLNLLRNSLIVAQSASDRFGQRDVRQFTVRCLLLNSPNSNLPNGIATPISGTLTLSFVGTVQRSAVPQAAVNTAQYTADQLAAYFSAPWWAPDIS